MNIIKIIGGAISGFLLLTLAIGFTCGPVFVIVCKVWGGILGMNTDFPHCYYACGF